MFKKSSSVFLSIAMLLSSSTMFGQGIDTFYYHPDSPVSLGNGVTKNFPLTQHRRCIERPMADANGNVAVPIDSNGATSVKFYVDFAKDTKELQRSLNMAAQIAAHIKFGKIFNPGLGVDAKSEKSYSLNETSIALVIKAEADYGRYEFNDYELKGDFQMLLDQEEHAKFAKICGTHFVIRERRVGLVSAIIKVEDLTEEEKKELSASLTLGELPPPPYDPNDPWLPIDPISPIIPDPIIPAPVDPNPIPIPDPIDFPDGGGSIDIGDIIDLNVQKPEVVRFSNDPGANQKYNGMRIGIDSFLRKAVKTGKKISLEFFATGGKGLSSLSKFVTDFSLKGIQMGLGEYLQNFTNDTTVPLKYSLASFELFGFEPEQGEVNNPLLSKIYYDYVEAEANYDKIMTSLSGLNDREDREEKVYYTKKKRELEIYMADLWKMAQDILKMRDVGPRDIPVATDIDWNKFQPQVSNLSNIFICESKGTTPCGKKRNLWIPTPYWGAGFEIAGKIAQLSKIKRVNLYQRNNAGVRKMIMSVGKGNKYPDRMLDNNGQFEFKLKKYTQREKRDDYVKMINSGRLPLFSIGLEYKSGQIKYVDLEQPRLIGNHQKWKN
jgi:hypothetical protein